MPIQVIIHTPKPERRRVLFKDMPENIIGVIVGGSYHAGLHVKRQGATVRSVAGEWHYWYSLTEERIEVDLLFPGERIEITHDGRVTVVGEPEVAKRKDCLFHEVPVGSLIKTAFGEGVKIASEFIWYLGGQYMTHQYTSPKEVCELLAPTESVTLTVTE